MLEQRQPGPVLRGHSPPAWVSGASQVTTWLEVCLTLVWFHLVLSVASHNRTLDLSAYSLLPHFYDVSPTFLFDFIQNISTGSFFSFCPVISLWLQPRPSYAWCQNLLAISCKIPSPMFFLRCFLTPKLPKNVLFSLVLFSRCHFCWSPFIAGLALDPFAAVHA